MAQLKDVCTSASSNIVQKDLENNNGQYPIFGASGLIKYVDFYKQSREYIAVVKDGAGVGRIMKCPAFSSVIGTMQYIIPNDNVDINYLSYVMEYMNLSKYYTGATIPHIYFKDYKNENFNLPDCALQKKIANIFDKINDLICERKNQISKLDELVKARFVELFGDIKINSFNVKTAPMTDICEIIDGDRGKNYPKQDEFFEEGFCLFLNAKNVTSNGFDFSNCMYISKEKDEILRKGKLTRGDVILTTRGTIGNLAYYSDDIPFENIRINSGMVILRMNHEIVDEIFFIEQFKLQLEDIKRKIASGSAQPQLPISTMNKINMIVPPINEQKYFSEFVEQVDKSKFEIQQSLEKLEILKKSLMQQYFG